MLLPVDLPLQAQDETSIRPVIKAVDLKKLEKANTYKADADKLIEEGNRLNMEVFAVQADPSLDEKAITKKTGLLESQAQQKQVQASALYEKCNEIKFSVYKQYLEEFWSDHAGEESNFINAKLLEEQASDNYFQATSYRIEAKKMDAGYSKIEKLTEANNLELQAIQKQLTALGAYHGIGGETTNQVAPPAEDKQDIVVEVPSEYVPPEAEPQYISSPPSMVENTLPGQLEINQSVIDAYNRYVSSGQFNDTTLSTGQITGVTSFDSDRLLQIWHEYIYGPESAGAVPFISATAAADSQQVVADEIPARQNQPAVQEEMEIGVVTDENKGRMVPSDEEVIYRVQLAANRTELSQRALSRMYYGNKGVEMINENGWYKYSVGDFSSYEEASKFRKSTGISNAFVVAYRKGTRFMAGTSVAEAVSQEIFTPAGEQRTPQGLIFRIQVAASRVPITPGQLERIYQGKYPVEMIMEDGWFKYQFMGVRLYSDALQIVRNVTTTGAFIVAYEDGAKIVLADAVRKNKELENTVKTRGRRGQIQEIEFHVQLAASKIAMQPDELKALYGGAEPVSIIFEDGWYKYHLKAGNSPETATQLQQSCGIPKAFIVPYLRAAKITYYEAIQETK